MPRIFLSLLLALIFLHSRSAIADVDQRSFGSHSEMTGAKPGDASAPFAAVANSPEANLFTGSLTTSVDIVVPPGRDKMTPKVRLSYSSSGGRSAAGYGWSVSASRIVRSTKNGAPTYKNNGDGADIFVLELNGESIELRLTSATSTVNRYEPKVQGSYLQVGFDKTANNWKVIDKDGTTYTFGASTTTRLGPSGAATFSWLLMEARDFSKNAIVYEYTTVGTPGLPKSIVYGQNVANSGSTDQFKVEFEYEDTLYPIATPVSYVGGFAHQSGKRLIKIVTKARNHYASTGSGHDVIREYPIEYIVDNVQCSQASPNTTACSSGSGVAVLSSVGLRAYGVDYVLQPDDTVDANPSTFLYAPAVQPGWQTLTSFNNASPSLPALQPEGMFEDQPGLGDGNRRYVTMDMNADSVADFLWADSNTTMKIAFGTAEGSSIDWSETYDFTWPLSSMAGMQRNPATAVVSNAGNLVASIFDLTGDGAPEFVETDTTRCSKACGLPQPYGGDPLWCYHGLTYTDARPDGFTSDAECWYAPSRPATGSDPAHTAQFIQYGDVGNVLDFDGDGRPDYLTGHGGTQGPATWYFYRNTGNGFDPAVVIHLPSSFTSGETNKGACNPPDYQFNPDGTPYSQINFPTPIILYTEKPCTHIAGGERGWQLSDINGDGLRDLVVPEDDVAGAPNQTASLVREHYWKVYLNTGRFKQGFGAETFEADYRKWDIEGDQSLNEYLLPQGLTQNLKRGGSQTGSTATTTISDLVDMTGDGLPDLVRRHASDAAMPSTRGTIDYTCGGAGVDPPTSLDEVGSFGPSGCWNLLVYVNTGSSFARPIAWQWPANAVRADRLPTSLGTGYHGNHTLMDFDGDGLVDLLSSNGSTWRVQRNPASPARPGAQAGTSKPNLLLSMMNGLGAESHIAYRPVTHQGAGELPLPIWVVTEIAGHDPLSCTSPVSRYGYNLAAFDRESREFRGFGSVRAVDTLGRSTITLFNQDGRRKGTMSRRYSFGAVTPQPDCQLPGGNESVNPEDSCSPYYYKMKQEDFGWGLPAEYSDSILPLQLASETTLPFQMADDAGEDAPVALQSLEKVVSYLYDGAGNERQREIQVGGVLIARTKTESNLWQFNSSPSTGMPERYLAMLPESVKTYDFTQGGKLIHQQKFTYLAETATGRDGKLDSSSGCRAWGTTECSGLEWATTRYEYDTWGNLVRTISPMQRITEVFFTEGGKHHYPRSTTDAARQKTTYEYDAGTGTKLTITDSNNSTTRFRYDGLGRPTKSWPEHGVFGSAQPRDEIKYFEPPVGVGLAPETLCRSAVEYGQAGRVESRSYETWTQSAGVLSRSPVVTFHDGFGRVLAEKSKTSTGPLPSDVKTIVSKLQKFRPNGLVESAAAPFETTNTNLSTFSEFMPALPGMTPEFDQHGRLVSKRLADGAKTVLKSDRPGVSVTVDANLALLNSAGAGSATITTSDGLGRKIKMEICSDDPVGPTYECPIGAGLSRFYYDYDALDRLVRQSQAMYPKVSVAQEQRRTIKELDYDGLGAVKEIRNYEAGLEGQAYGTYTNTYDLDGLPIEIEQPSGVSTVNTYDSGGRLKATSTKKNGRESNGVSYVYGQNYIRFNNGRTTRVKTHSRSANGKKTVVDKTFTYTSRGMVETARTKIISQLYGKSTVTLAYGYDEIDRPVDTIYPATTVTGSAATQTATVEYDDYGRLFSMVLNGNGQPERSLVEYARYDIFGHLKDIKYGNGVHDYASYGTINENFRLKCLRTRKDDVANPATCDNYTSSDHQVLAYSGYDWVGRIGTINDVRGSSETFNDQNFIYDELGRLTHAAYAGGGYESFSVDDMGRMSGRGGSSSADAGMFTFSVDHPHRPTAFNMEAMEYEADGNRISRGLERYRFDGRNRLIAHSTKNQGDDNEILHEANVYDEGETRVVRYAADWDDVRHYFDGGRVELARSSDGFSQLVRQFTFGGRVIAFDVGDTSSAYFIEAPSWSALSVGAGKGRIGSEQGRSPATEQRYSAKRSQLLAKNTLGVFLVLTALGGTLLFTVVRAPQGRYALPVVFAFLASVVPLPAVVATHSYAMFGVTEAYADASPELSFLHVDHLGSVQVVTSGEPGSALGNAIDSTRYRAYGQVRCTMSGGCSSTAEYTDLATSSPRGFTGHLSPGSSGLVYMGARHYDPDLGMFLSLDPAEQFPSPYVYGGLNPIAGTDPTGAEIFTTAFIVVAVLSATASFIDTLVTTGDVGAAFAGLVISAVASVLSAPAGTVISEAVSESTASVIAAIGRAYSAYSAVEGFRSGHILSGLLSLGLLAVGVAGSRSRGGAMDGNDSLDKSKVTPWHDDGGSPLERTTRQGVKLTISGGLANDREAWAYMIEENCDSMLWPEMQSGLSRDGFSLSVKLMDSDLFRFGKFGTPAEVLDKVLRIDPRMFTGHNELVVLSHEFGHLYGGIGGTVDEGEPRGRAWAEWRSRELNYVYGTSTPNSYVTAKPPQKP